MKNLLILFFLFFHSALSALYNCQREGCNGREFYDYNAYCEHVYKHKDNKIEDPTIYIEYQAQTSTSRQKRTFVYGQSPDGRYSVGCRDDGYWSVYDEHEKKFFSEVGIIFVQKIPFAAKKIKISQNNRFIALIDTTDVLCLFDTRLHVYPWFATNTADCFFLPESIDIEIIDINGNHIIYPLPE